MRRQDGLPRVWTWIDPVNSYALLNLWRPDRPPTLADLNRQDSFLLIPGAPVPILTTARPSEKPALLQAGSLVGQGFALRVGDLGCRLTLCFIYGRLICTLVASG